MSPSTRKRKHSSSSEEPEKVPKLDVDPSSSADVPDIPASSGNAVVQVQNETVVETTVETAKQNEADKNQKSKKPKVYYPYGNYLFYYGYRYDHSSPFSKEMKNYFDPRIQALSKKSNKYFKNRDVLDIGCNTGMITLMIAKKYLPRKIVGCDIDKKLIDLARKNIHKFLDSNLLDSKKSVSGELTVDKNLIENPPATFTEKKGELLAPIMHSENPDASFPNNVLFFSGDYCPKNDDHVNDQTPEYDTIMAFSVSKWIHLNNLDEGILRFFQRVFRALRGFVWGL